MRDPGNEVGLKLPLVNYKPLSAHSVRPIIVYSGVVNKLAGTRKKSWSEKFGRKSCRESVEPLYLGDGILSLTGLTVFPNPNLAFTELWTRSFFLFLQISLADFPSPFCVPLLQ